MLKKTILTLVKTLLPLGIGVYLFWLFFSSMSEEHIASFKKALKEANASGKGTVVVNDKLVEHHHIKAAQRLIQLHEAIAELEESAG